MSFVNNYPIVCGKNLFNHLFDVENKGIKKSNLLDCPIDTFIEHFDKNKLAFVLKNSESLPITKNGDDSLHKILKRLYKYYFNSKAKTYNVNYEQKKDNLYGRRYSKFGIGGQMINKSIRHTIYKDFYDDIDMVNCHPVILQWLTGNLQIETEYLDLYISKREIYINELLVKNPSKTRGDIKNVFLSIMYSGDSEYNKLNKTAFLTKFYNELKKITNAILDKLSYFHDVNTTLKGSDYYNLKGSSLSKICAYVEDQLLMIMCNYFQSSKLSKKFNRSILCYDGIMIPKSDKKDLAVYISELENLFNNIGIGMKLSVKEMTDDIKLLDYNYDCNEKYVFIDPETVKSKPITDNKFEYVKKNYFEDDEYYYSDFVNEGSQIFKSFDEMIKYVVVNLNRVLLIVNDMYIKKLNDHEMYDVKNKKKSDMSLVLHYLTECDEETEPEIKAMALSKIISEYQKYFYMYNKINCDFDFERSNKKNVYTCRKYVADQVDYIDMDLVNPLLNFIKTVFCQNDDYLMDYFIKWLAFIVKFPMLKSKKAFILYSEKQQVGKGTILSFLCDYVFGSYNSLPNVKGLKSVSNANNYQLLNKKFAVVNELSTVRDEFHNMFDDLKSIVSDVDVEVKKLFVDVYHAKQYCEFIFCTNNKYSFKIESGDFRYVIMEVNNIYHNNTSFLESFNKQIRNKETGDAFYSYLLNQINTPSDFTLLKLPETGIKDTLKELSKSNIEQFIDFIKIDSVNYFHHRKSLELKKEQGVYLSSDELEELMFLDDRYIRPDIKGRFLHKTLFNKYKEFCKESNITNCGKVSYFKAEMKKSVFDIKIINGKDYYVYK